MGDTQRGLGEFSYMEIEQRLTLAAPLAKVFSALTGDLSDWWGAPYLLAASAKRVVLEPRPGGRLVELWGDPSQGIEEGALWGVVAEIADAELIVIEGAMGMSWPTRGRVTFELKAVGGTGAPARDETGMAGEFATDEGVRATELTLLHQAWGRITASARDNYEWGWRDLLQRRLRAWVENGERMGIGNEPLPWLGIEPPDS